MSGPVPVTALWQRLVARFDDDALRPFEAHGSQPSGSGTPWPALRQWCEDEAARPLAVAAPSSVDLDVAARSAAALALVLDGSTRLQACRNNTERQLLRARAKLHDLTRWPWLRAAVWDCGWVPQEPAAWQAMTRFVPRRPTFVVMDRLPAAAVAPMLSSLRARSETFLAPVRVLVLGAEDALPEDIDLVFASFTRRGA
jgi:hypothetical protein